MTEPLRVYNIRTDEMTEITTQAQLDEIFSRAQLLGMLVDLAKRVRQEELSLAITTAYAFRRKMGLG